MKKSDFILIGLVLVVVIVGVLSSKGTRAEEEIHFPLELSGEVGLNQITYDEYKDMVLNNEAFIVVLKREGCGYCTQYMPIIEEVANDNNIAITYIDTDSLTNEEFNELSSTNEYLKKNSWGTPTTLFMLGDRVIDAIGGYVEKSVVDKFIEDRVVLGE